MCGGFEVGHSCVRAARGGTCGRMLAAVSCVYGSERCPRWVAVVAGAAAAAGGGPCARWEVGVGDVVVS